MKEQFHIVKPIKKYLLFTFFIIFIPFFSNFVNAQEIYEISSWDKLYQHGLYNATIFQINKTEGVQSDLKNYVLGTCYYFIGKYDLAEFYLKKVSSHFFRYKHDPVAYYLGIISFFNNNFLISATYFNEISSNYDKLEESGKFIYYFSLALIEIGKPDIALKFLQIGLDSNYEFYKQYYSFTIAKIYYNLQDYSKAASEFEKFLFLYSDSSLADDTLYYMGKSYYNLNDFKNAKRAFSSIISLFRTSEYYYSSLYYLGQITGNKIYLEEIILKNPSFNLIDYVYYFLAKLYYEEGQSDKAYIYFNEAFFKTENQLLKYNCIVYIIKIKGDISISYLEQLNSNQRKPILEFLLSNYFYFKQFEKIFNLEKSIFSQEINSSSSMLAIIGKTYLETQNVKKSLEIFLEALKLNPIDYKLYFFIGYCYYKLEEYDNAQKLFNKVILEINIEPYYGYYSYLYLGILELKKGNYKNSQQYFEQILLKYPTYKTIGEVYYFISIVFYNLHDYRKALSAIEFAYASNILGNLRLAIIYQYTLVMMRFDSTKTMQLFNEFENISEDNKQVSSLSLKLAEYYFSLSKYEVAKSFYDKALIYTEDEKNKIDIILQILTIYYNTQKFEQAFVELKELVKSQNSYRKKDILFLFFNTAIQLKNLEAADLLLSLDNEQLAIFNNFIFQFLNFYKEKKMYNDALNYINNMMKKIEGSNNIIEYDLLLNKAQIFTDMNELEKAFEQYQKMYEKYFEKRKDIEYFIVDCALKLKNIQFLINKIPVLLGYDDENLRNYGFYVTLKLYLLGKIDDKYIFNLNNQNFFRQDDIKFIIFSLYLSNKMNLKKQTESLKQYLSSKNPDTAYWARFFYALALFDAKDLKNSRLLAESILSYSNDFQKEFVYYLLSMIENIEGKEKKYWELLLKEYPSSLFL